jgi:hypothetical protein
MIAVREAVEEFEVEVSFQVGELFNAEPSLPLWEASK